jgi:autoinducer 2-degrading protein
MISITVILEVDPHRVDEFVSAIMANAAASREEPGCLRFEVSRHLEKANVFALSELYHDREAVESHYGSDHFALWKKVADTGIVASRTAVRGEVMQEVES